MHIKMIRLMETHLPSIGHLHAVQRAPSRSRHFTHKAGLQETEGATDDLINTLRTSKWNF